MQISGRPIGDDAPVYVIAEIGSNHDGDKARALELIRACAQAGADAVKFQLFKADSLVNPSLRPDFHGIIQHLEFPRDWLRALKDYADAHGIHFLATPFDLEAVALLDALEVPALKIASSDLTNWPLLRAAAQTSRPVIISAGLAYLGEVEEAVLALRSFGATEIAVLHCVAEYPTRDEDVNLRYMALMEGALGVPVGFSDHTRGLGAPVAAAALGACIIEKHVTHSRLAQGPDHFFALEMPELSQLVVLVREAEKARGKLLRTLTAEELADRDRARRGVFARVPIPAGARVTADMLVALRPARGIAAKDFDQVVGKTARVRIEPYAPLAWSDFI
jgi:N,N'-diacetyllegionaminate synthase